MIPTGQQPTVQKTKGRKTLETVLGLLGIAGLIALVLVSGIAYKFSQELESNKSGSEPVKTATPSPTKVDFDEQVKYTLVSYPVGDTTVWGDSLTYTNDKSISTLGYRFLVKGFDSTVTEMLVPYNQLHVVELPDGESEPYIIQKKVKGDPSKDIYVFYGPIGAIARN